MYWAAGCGGCDMSLLEIGPHLLELDRTRPTSSSGPASPTSSTATWPATRTATSTCASSTARVRNSEEEELVRLLRRKSRTLVAYGACAVEGGMPALANLGTVEAIFDAVYRNNPSLDNPDGVLPPHAHRDVPRRA